MRKLANTSGGVAIFLLSVLSLDGFVLNSRQAYIISSTYNNRPELFSSADDNAFTSSNNNPSPEPLSTAGDWSAYLDESKGLLYYFHHRTGLSQWEPPADVVFPEIIMSSDKKLEVRAQLKNYLQSRLNDSSKDTNIIDEMGKERERIEKKRQEAYEKLQATKSKLEAMKRISQQQKQVQTRSNIISDSSSTTSDLQEQQLPKIIDDTKLTSLPIVQQGEWSAYFDIKSGLVFYYNERTKVSLWDPPTKDFPRVIMENNIPKVLDPRKSNISMERALTMTIEEDEAKQKWQEAKEKEKVRKAKLRAEKAMAAEGAEKRDLAAEQTNQQEEATTTQSKYEAAMTAELRRLEQERIVRDRKVAEAQVLLDQERLKSEREATAMQKKAEENRKTEFAAANAETTAKKPVLPKGEPAFTADNVENISTPLKGSNNTTAPTLYDILQCSPNATRSELKRAYITLAKETHPDALLQAGLRTNETIQDKFVEVSQAWTILGDVTSRRRYDREITAKGVSTKAGSMFTQWVMGAAKKMDEALSKAEDELENTRKKQS